MKSYHSDIIYYMTINIIVNVVNLHMNWLSVRNNQLKFKASRKNTNQFRGFYGILCLKLIQQNRKNITCNWLDLKTLGFRLIMLKILLGHCCETYRVDKPISDTTPKSYCIESPKVKNFHTCSCHFLMWCKKMKNHTCSLHIWRDGKKS